MKPTFFATPAKFRAWLERNHERETQLLVGFHKKGSGRPSITWQESVDQALCFGWIDGVRKRIDEASYTIRFSRRRLVSTWSSINLRRAKDLVAQRLMQPSGLAALKRRSKQRASTYSYEQRRNLTLDPKQQRTFRAERDAWNFFRAQAPSYQHLMTFWIVSAKRPETQRMRLDRLIRASAARRRL